MALLSSPLDTLLGLQQALDAFRTSGWLDAGPSGGGAYPPVNVFRKGDDFAVIAEVPGVQKSELEVQVQGNTLRLAGRKAVRYPEGAGLHRRERLSGRVERVLPLPVEIDPEGGQAEYPDGLLAPLVTRAARGKPRTSQGR